MGSLSNLYISQSYQSLLHFGNDSSASTSLVQLQDGVGNGLGVSLNTKGDLDVQRQLIVHDGAEITGAVDINTTFSGSTQGFVNQSSVNNQIQITGSYTPTGNQASITEIGIGWLVNGGAVSNGRVINITGTPNSNVTYTIDQFYTANNVTYTFTGSIQRPVEIEGDLNVSDDLFVGGHLTIEDGVEITGSIDITGDVTASNAFIENNLIVSGTISAFKIVTTIESASVIFSSGSNILGDSILDTQTLNGTIIMSGSSELTGSMTISNNISSSTVSGIGNVTIYSASVNNRLNIVEATASLYVPFSQSVDGRLDYLEGTFSSSVSSQIISLQQFTASIGLITSESFNTYTASTDADLASIHQTTASLNTATASFNTSIVNLNIATASLNSFTSSTFVTFSQSVANRFTFTPTTGNNTYVGNQIFSGSVRGNTNILSISSNTASMDCSLGNFFILNLQAGINTRLEPTNILPGETLSLRVNQNVTPGTISYPSSIKFADGSPYTASITSGAIDVLSFISFDNSTLFGAAANKMV